ncbi:MAG TPA: SCO family protein, partial [Candidatus Tenderia sp.]|nr:SCO family protein [Candidatus Tenderia sp.]
MKTKRTLVLISFLLISISVAAGLFWRGEPPPLEFTDIKGISIISPPVSLPDINLKDHNGKRITLDDFKGHWSMAFFGYTHCPDVCPTSLAVMKRVA